MTAVPFGRARERRLSDPLRAALLASTLAFLISGCGGGAGIAPFPKGPSNFPSPQASDVLRLSTDIFSNGSSQHATEVEPSAVSFGSTIVAAFQSGRFFNAGSSDIAFATSHDGGMTWLDGVLPGTTNIVQPGSAFDSISDPSVAYDALHGVWLIAGLPVIFSGAPAPAAVVSRSSDGFSWSNPISIAPNQTSSDKDWIACDDSPGSPYYGHCYVEWDNSATNGTILMSTSVDGGLTWGPPLATANNATGIGGQPVVLPNGRVVVPVDDYNEFNVLSFVSTNGGASWNAAIVAASISDHFEAANLRSAPLPSAAVDAGGTVYLVWQDCRFRNQCAENDIVLSTSSDGGSWTAPTRVPIDAQTSAVDHFLPGIRVAPLTAGPSAHLGITYYYYPNTACAPANCALDVGYISSLDGGSTWSNPVFLSGPMSVQWLAQTNIGAMVGDYTTTVFAGNQPYGIFALAHQPSGELNEAMYITKAGTIALATGRRSSFGERAIPGAHSDHPPRKPPPPESMNVLANPLGGD